MMKLLFLHFVPLLCFCFVYMISFSIWSSTCCLADSSSSSVQDICPTAPPPTDQQKAVFINGLPCKNPGSAIASDFKTSRLNHAGDTDNIQRSSMDVITASEFPGINTLGISLARTDLDVDGMILPHSHPRASEMLYVSRGSVVVAFIDTGDELFQKKLVEGDVFVFPRGLLHFCLNAGVEHATMFSVLNSQNPGVAKVAAVVGSDPDDHEMSMMMMMKMKMKMKMKMMKRVVLSRIHS